MKELKKKSIESIITFIFVGPANYSACMLNIVTISMFNSKRAVLNACLETMAFDVGIFEFGAKFWLEYVIFRNAHNTPFVPQLIAKYGSLK